MMHQKPSGRQNDENLPLEVGFCPGRLEESLFRVSWPRREGKVLQTVLQATESAAGHTGRATQGRL